MQAYALAILGAEYIARLLPRGTHDWSQFITPSAHGLPSSFQDTPVFPTHAPATILF
jgi:2-polyprenyl-3-methyl-5-hydroxy-6-metoxy-1,4-benzoquinol methylase